MYIAPVTLQIIAYTPTSLLRASLAAFKFFVICKFVNYMIRRTGGIPESGVELEVLEVSEEFDELVVFTLFKYNITPEGAGCVVVV
jgi:hypothetical protein